MASMKLVLVADDIVLDKSEATPTNRQVDRIHRYYVEEISEAIRAAGYDVQLYTSPAELIANVHKHQDDLVFPYWQGTFSKNRHALGPAICEAAGLKYIGGDAFAKSVCNDKHLTKLLCRDLGLDTPSSVALNTASDLRLLKALRLPFVLKPMFEGSSLGITQRNLVRDLPTARELATELLAEFGGPIIAEEFVSGKEVSICLMGYGDTITEWAAGERYVLEDESYLLHNLYSFDAKYVEEDTLGMRNVKAQIWDGLFLACRRMFHYLDKVEYMRIDGKLTADKFEIIELTPESHLGKNAEFCSTFTTEGRLSYEDVIRSLIENCLERYRRVSPAGRLLA
jgi:D-alanine-D-alanine ligase